MTRLIAVTLRSISGFRGTWICLVSGFYLEHIYHGIGGVCRCPGAGGLAIVGIIELRGIFQGIVIVEIGTLLLALSSSNMFEMVYHHRSVPHIDEFCGEIEVTLKVRGHNNIYYNIGGLLAEYLIT